MGAVVIVVTVIQILTKKTAEKEATVKVIFFNHTIKSIQIDMPDVKNETFFYIFFYYVLYL